MRTRVGFFATLLTLIVIAVRLPANATPIKFALSSPITLQDAKKYTFVCCGDIADVNDLTLVFKSELGAIIVSPAGCETTVKGDAATITATDKCKFTNKTTIEVAGITEKSEFDVLSSACWSTPKKPCAKEVSPVPEPPTLALVFIGALVSAIAIRHHPERRCRTT